MAQILKRATLTFTLLFNPTPDPRVSSPSLEPSHNVPMLESAPLLGVLAPTVPPITTPKPS